MVAPRSVAVAALLLVHLLTGCAADVDAVGPAEYPASGGALPRDESTVGTVDPPYLSPLPVISETEPGAYGVAEPLPAFGPSPFPANPEEGDLRLVRQVKSDTTGRVSGALQVFIRGEFGNVCTNKFGQPDADVACRQLGFVGGIDDPGKGSQDQIFRGLELDVLAPIVLDNLNCTGTEDRLVDCPGATEPLPEYAYYYDHVFPGGGCSSVRADFAFVSCETLEESEDEYLQLGSVGVSEDGISQGGRLDTMQAEGSLRLMEGQAGPGFEYGRLEIFQRGLWRSVCDKFTPDSAKVACSSLGYDGGAVLRTLELPSEGPVGLEAVDCAGNESSLLECSSRISDDSGEHQFGPALFVNCRFVGGGNEGPAVLACGMSSGSCPAPATPVRGAVRLRGGFGTPCDPVHTGFVEVFNDGEWGAICSDNEYDDSFLTAKVICRQLGFSHGGTMSPVAIPIDLKDFQSVPPVEEENQEPQERFWLSQANCDGLEARLLDCPLGPGFLEENAGCGENRLRLTVECRSFPVAEAVTTPGAEEGDVRLVQRTTVANWEIGRLEIFLRGSWGKVCGTNTFTASDAAVVCRQLGFGAAALWPNSIAGRPRRPNPEQPVAREVVLAGTPGCNGTERAILECSNEGTIGTPFDDSTGCRGGMEIYDVFGVNVDVVIACVAAEDAGTEGDLRLVDGGIGGNDPATGVGILEIFHAGAWGTVCNGDPTISLEDRDYYGDDILTMEAAVVACRQLGFDEGEFRSLGRSVSDRTDGQGIQQFIFPGGPLLPSWLADVPCTGTEDTLMECDNLAFGDTASCGFSQRLVCSNGAQEFPMLTPRLVDGDADPGGAWQYGRLQMFDGETFVLVADSNRNQGLGRRGAIVACRTFGFATGGQALSGDSSALPDVTAGDTNVGNVEIVCDGDEATLVDCELQPGNGIDYNYAEVVEARAVALLCYNPSGCQLDSNITAAVQGDIRLVRLNGTDFGTQPCDDVHMGGVEFFNNGRWGRLCGDGLARWVVDAIVICRQLGFPFGNIMDSEEKSTGVSESENQISWASRVFCKGTEDRLKDCSFPESPGDIMEEIPGGCSDDETLSVMCRRFPLAESGFIRRL